MSPRAACFARDVVTRAAPGSPARARALLWAAGKLADYAIGLEPVPPVLLHPSVTGRFAVSAPGLSGPARRTLRTSLRFLARRAVPALAPADALLPRERCKAPYSAAEIAGYLALADAQPTMARRMRASGLICLGAGAGLIRSDLRQARGSGIVRRSGGVIVSAGGHRPRVVPVLAGYHPRQPAPTPAEQHRSPPVTPETSRNVRTLPGPRGSGRYQSKITPFIKTHPPAKLASSSGPGERITSTPPAAVAASRDRSAGIGVRRPTGHGSCGGPLFAPERG